MWSRPLISEALIRNGYALHGVDASPARAAYLEALAASGLVLHTEYDDEGANHYYCAKAPSRSA